MGGRRGRGFGGAAEEGAEPQHLAIVVPYFGVYGSSGGCLASRSYSSSMKAYEVRRAEAEEMLWRTLLVPAADRASSSGSFHRAASKSRSVGGGGEKERRWEWEREWVAWGRRRTTQRRRRQDEAVAAAGDGDESAAAVEHKRGGAGWGNGDEATPRWKHGGGGDRKSVV